MATQVQSLSRHAATHRLRRAVGSRALLADAANEQVWKAAAALAAVHVVLAIVMKQYAIVATMHAWGTLTLGLVWALRGKPTLRLACLGSYVAGCDVLWRMTHAVAFWEMGKYVLIAMFLLAMQSQRQIRRTSFPVGYFALFLPAALLTVEALDFGLMRRQVSFNLSGPLALAVSAAYFSRMRLSHGDVTRLLVSFLVPVAGVWAIVFTGIVTANKLTFATESSSALSGGFGPNQVSSILGCGALVAFLLALFCTRKWDRASRAILLALALTLGTQSALTFSRSGLYLAVASGAIACALAVRDARRRATLLVAGVVIYAVAAFVIVPRVDAFTQGQLGKRFGEANTTGRVDLMKADLLVWRDHFLLGVGPGMAATERMKYWGDHSLAAHSEVTRTLSEHGLLGLIALCWMGWSICCNGFAIRRPDTRAMVLGVAAFSVLLLAGNSMRIVLASFAIGLCFADFGEAAQVGTGRLPIKGLRCRSPKRIPAHVNSKQGR